jgi:hypothetical protein
MKIKKFNELRNKLNESKDDLLPPFSSLSPYEMKDVYAAFKTIFNVCIEHDVELNGLIKTDKIIDKIKEDINNYIDAYEEEIVDEIDKEFISDYEDIDEIEPRDDFEEFEEFET